MESTNRWRLSFILTCIISLSACGSLMSKGDGPSSKSPKDFASIPDAIPRVEPIRQVNQKSYVVFGKRYYPMSTAAGYREQGIASWYGKQFHGNPTATGERYDMHEMTAAHKTMPLPSYAEVRNLDNGRKIVVRVNDRGPFHDGRIIDLSYAAASKLGIVGRGTGRVEVIAIDAKTYNEPVKLPPPPAPVMVKKPVVVEAQKVITVEPEKILPTGYHTHADGEAHAHEHKAGPSVFLQVGTFSTLARAEEFKARIATQVNEAVFVMPLYRETGRLYRVRVGPLKSVEASDSLAAKLKAVGVKDSHAVVE